MKQPHILDNFSSHLKNTIAGAIALATSLRHKQVSPLHLLFAMLDQEGSVGQEILDKMVITKEHIEPFFVKLDDPNTDNTNGSTALLPDLDNESRTAIEKAMVLAYDQQHQYVGTEHLLFGLLSIQSKSVASVIKKAKRSRKLILEQVETVIRSTSKFPQIDELQELVEDIQEMQQEASQTMQFTKKKRKQSALSAFATKLTDKTVQKDIDPVIGRESEIDRLIQILSRRTKNNPVLVGEPGVGKTAIVEGLAKRIIQRNVPANLQRINIYSLDLTSLISGTMYRGEFEARIKQVIDEVSATENTVLFIDELHNIIGAGSNQGTMDAANILKPALARGKLRCIGATTLDEYSKYIKKDPALERRFQPIDVKEPSRDEAIEILTGVKKYYEKYHQVKISKTVIPYIVDSSIQYIHDNYLPDKAFDLLDESSAKVRLAEPLDANAKRIMEIEDYITEAQKEKELAISAESFDRAKSIKTRIEQLQKQKSQAIKKQKNKKQFLPEVTKETVSEILSTRLNVDAKILLQDSWEQITTLEKKLNTVIFGQEDAIEKTIHTLRHAKLKYRQKGPHASFLFIGPSGVGKTALAKTLAASLYHDKEALISFDMSEFSESHSVSKLLGSPAGYVGHDSRNRFTEQLRKRPYAVILFDEVDKAHPDVIRLLLQILDEGKLTDSSGKTISFEKSIIAMTSNLGAELYDSNGIGFGEDASDITKRQTAIIGLLKERFSKALVSRIDTIIPFAPLSESALKKIITTRIKELNESLSIKERTSISISNPTLANIAKNAYNKDSGARSIEQYLARILDAELVRVFSGKRRKKQYTLKETDGSFSLA